MSLEATEIEYDEDDDVSQLQKPVSEGVDAIEKKKEPQVKEYTDSDGVVMEWDAEKRAFFPKVLRRPSSLPSLCDAPLSLYLLSS